MFGKIDLSKLVTKDGLASPLKLDVFVVCGSLTSHIDIKNMVDTLSGHTENDSVSLSFEKDATIVCETSLITGETSSRVLLPTEKKNVTKILRKDYPLGKDVVRIKYCPNSKKTKDTKKKGDNTFYNCATIEMLMDTSNISCKVFTNGKLHIAGCRTTETSTKVIETIRDFIPKYAPNAIRNKEYYGVSNVRIVMLKTSFKFRATFDLESLGNIVRDYNTHEEPNSRGSWGMTKYEPNKFSGLKIERLLERERSTILIFRTGSATIAAKTVEQLVDSYKAISTLIQRNRDDPAVELLPLDVFGKDPSKDPDLQKTKKLTAISIQWLEKNGITY